MLRYDEEKRGPSYRTKGHIEVKMHLGKGTFCCSTLNPCCRQLLECVPETSRGCPQDGQNVMNKVKSGGNLKR